MDTEVDDLHYLELVELAALIKVRKISPLEVVRAQLDRIAALGGGICTLSFCASFACRNSRTP